MTTLCGCQLRSRGSDRDVLGLHVAVRDAAIVAVRQSRNQLHKDVQAALLGEGAPRRLPPRAVGGGCAQDANGGSNGSRGEQVV